jgi:hydrogenase maturation factor HypF (carbamoyltransferase family)
MRFEIKRRFLCWNYLFHFGISKFFSEYKKKLNKDTQGNKQKAWNWNLISYKIEKDWNLKNKSSTDRVFWNVWAALTACYKAVYNRINLFFV